MRTNEPPLAPLSARSDATTRESWSEKKERTFSICLSKSLSSVMSEPIRICHNPHASYSDMGASTHFGGLCLCVMAVVLRDEGFRGNARVCKRSSIDCEGRAEIVSRASVTNKRSRWKQFSCDSQWRTVVRYTLTCASSSSRGCFGRVVRFPLGCLLTHTNRTMITVIRTRAPTMAMMIFPMRGCGRAHRTHRQVTVRGIYPGT